MIKFETRVKISAKSEVVVQLLDLNKNPIILSGPKLHLQIGTKNDSTFTTYPFTEMDGLYHGYYVVREVGVYNVCVVLEDKALSPCPFEVQVHEGNPTLPTHKTIIWPSLCQISKTIIRIMMMMQL
jgi:Filamin/ABP280 repeat